MQETQELLQGMQRRLEQLGIPCHDIKVFGRIRMNVHVRCLSRDTASKWALVLGQVFSGNRVVCNPTTWNASGNKGTVMRPTMQQGWLVAVAG